MVLSQTQSLSNWRSKSLVVTGDSLQLDTLTIVAGTVSIFHSKSAKAIKDFQVKNNIVIFEDASDIKGQSVDVRYRVFPYDLGKTYTHLDTTRIQVAEDGSYIGFNYDPYEKQQGIIDFQGLNYNGSFARGISFGNNQNLVLNSSFNLQLSGNLGDDIEILAAITDSNIPLQPEGNTQQLKEFDKIFIQLKRRNNMLIAGDYELDRPNSYFMNYFKKLQGATFSNKTELSKKGILNSKASVAIARGKFTRNTITPQEGNQGPYKLQGREGERFIIVLAGTERVYIDGKLMSRGLEEDYTIDYNQAEVRFTNKQLITKDRRIIVEFEYANQTYLRSLYAINTEFTNKKWRLYLNAFSEQDGKNSTGAQELSPQERLLLANIGDRIDTLVTGIDTLAEGFDPDRIMYEATDTTVHINGADSLYTIIRYSTSPETARFVARFSDVGQGNGNYIVDASQAANGRVYTWVGPDTLTGLPMGQFEPVIRLAAPNKQQLFTFGAEYQLSPNASIHTELALSNNDLNRFSEIDNDDNTSLAVYTQFKSQKDLGKKKNWQIQTNLNYELVQEDFRALNPYRSAEFNRDWNITQTLNAPIQTSAGTIAEVNEQVAKAGLSLIRKNFGSIDYKYSRFLRGDIYDGYKHLLLGKINKGGFNINIESNLLESESDIEKTHFYRPKIDISKAFKKLNNWTIGVYAEREKNERSDINTDTLRLNSFYYDLAKFYLKSPNSRLFSFGVNYTKRKDYAPFKENFVPTTLADEVNLNGNWNKSRRSQLRWNFTYRQLEILDSLRTNQQAQETYLGRLNYSLNLFKGAVSSNTIYEIGSGQEAKLEYTYLRVNPGEGSYQWNDYNQDSIQQINEFEIPVYADSANYTRVTIATDQFIRSNSVQLNQSLFIKPKAIWFNKKKGIKKFLSAFSTKSNLRIVRRTRESNDITPWNPFQRNIADSSLVSTTSNIQNALFYFSQGKLKYDFQLGMMETQKKVVLVTGFESGNTEEQFFRIRWNLGKTFSTQFYIAQGARTNDSEFFNDRDYYIDFYKIEPQLTWASSKNIFRAILKYKFLDSQNTLFEDGEAATNNDFSLETTYRKNANTSIRTKLSFVKVNYIGEKNTPVAFAMLEGLQNGQNYIWNLGFERKLGKNVNLDISYEGRKSGILRTIHIGRAQVRATF